MKRLHRLRSAHDFQLLFRRGRRIDSALFRIVIQKNNYTYARFACVTPRTVDKRAVVRNRVRRRIREWFRRSPFLAYPFDIALLVKKEAATAPRKKIYEELEEETRKIFSRIR